VQLLAGIDLGIAFEVHKELLVPLGYGYHFPETVFARCETIYPNYIPPELIVDEARGCGIVIDDC
jgi:hypothetical protein